MQNITTGSNTTRVEYGQGQVENMIDTNSWMCFKRSVFISTFPITVSSHTRLLCARLRVSILLSAVCGGTFVTYVRAQTLCTFGLVCHRMR
jgi:hypothetical protein